ncbi:MAG TPA: acyl-CoA dehydrogenase family protein [Stellaceae bacterium]|nr:acyl-CoA dehydrogenase family protein [Stellaceae bacterium]
MPDQGPSPAAIDYIARAHALAPLIEAASPRIEAGRRFPDDVLSALHDAGMFRLLLPKSFGGAELDLPRFVRICEILGAADASVAWCVSQGGGCATAAAYVAPEVARDIFGAPRAVLSWGPPVSAPGKALAVPGGYRLTGNWSFASGSPHCTWLGSTHCIVYDAEGKPRLDPKTGQPLRRVMMFPKTSATMIDVWDVIGLKGTGSDNYSVSDLFVPEAYTFAIDDPADRREAGPLYRFSTLGLYGYAFAGGALGIARAALDGFVRLASTKVPYRFSSTLRENARVQAEIGLAEARLRAARFFLLNSLDDIWNAVAGAGRDPTLDERLTLRLATTHVMREAKDVVATIYEFAGSSAIFAQAPFERRFRDIHAMTQHMQARWTNYETVGQALLGLTPAPFV